MWLLLPWTACAPEYSVQRQDRVDVFEQSRLDAIDLLLVVDNSCSMLDEQQHLAASFAVFIDALEAGNTDWRLAVTTPEPSLEAFRGVLEGATDEIVLAAADGTPLDAVSFDDRTWDLGTDVAFSRCGGSMWSAAPASPGARNPCVDATADGRDAGPRSPGPGELWVSEFLARPSEAGCGWVELWNPTADTLDLSGVVVRDDGRDHLSLPIGTRLAPGGTFVIGARDGCATAADRVDPGLHLATGDRWVDRNTPDAERVFSELVAVGTGGFGLEMGFENALLALESPQNPATDADFLRDEADLALVFFSDEDDASPGSVADYVNAFRALEGTAGQREAGRVRFAVVAGVDAPTGPDGISCSSDGGEAVWAPRYRALADVTGGPAWSICGALDAVAESVGLTFSEQVVAFRLSGVPALDTLTTEVYASVASEELLLSPARGVDFHLEVEEVGDEQRIWLVFEDGVIPPGSVLVVEYELLPDSATFVSDTTP